MSSIRLRRRDDDVQLAPERPVLPRTVVVVGARLGAPAHAFGTLVADALRAHGSVAVWRAGRAPDESPDTWVDPESAAPTTDFVVALGVAFVARRRPALAVLVTGGASPVSFEPSVRELGSLVDLELSEPRPFLARTLAERLALSVRGG
jgi:hypothetical protein